MNKGGRGGGGAEEKRSYNQIQARSGTNTTQAGCQHLEVATVTLRLHSVRHHLQLGVGLVTFNNNDIGRDLEEEVDDE